MKVYIEKEDKTIDLAFKGSAQQLLKKLQINPVTVIVVRDNTLITLDTKLQLSDSITIKPVLSGG